MSEGIPIPQARHPYYCSGCGDYHAPGKCPRFGVPAPLAAAAETQALRAEVRDLLAQVADTNSDLQDAEENLRDEIDGLKRRLAALEDRAVTVDDPEIRARLTALEAARKDKKR